MKLLGLSLSFCVQDIVQNDIPLERVKHIITACSPESEQDVKENIVDYYCKIYWKDFPGRAREVVNELRDSNRIMWCSHWDKNPVCGSTFWLPYPDVNEDFPLIQTLTAVS